MTYMVNKIVDTYNYIFTDLADQRTNHFFLLSSPWPMLGLTGVYLYFCTSFGQRYMRDRPPYNLKNVVLLYNIFQVSMSAYLFYEGMMYITSEKYRLSCAPVDRSNDRAALRIAHATWWYFFSKITEFLDTIFFVLRKKNNQITFLHVYHHAMMVVTMWIGVKYIPGGHGIFMGTLNAFVHIVMYTYYLVSGLGPQYQKYVWWKKHVTVLQLVQFVLILIHNVLPLFTDCSYPKIFNILLALNSTLFLNLFGRFFYANYIKASVKNGPVKKGSATNGTTTNGSATNGITTNGTATNGSATNGKITNGTATNGIVKNKKHTNLHNKHSIYEKSDEKNGIIMNGKRKAI